LIYFHKEINFDFFFLFSRDWTEVTEVPARDHSYTIPNLKDGDEVSFRIIAVNAVGPSEASKPTDTIIVQDQPGLLS
jgi:hypothetical protein